ncbi:phosphatase domain-containing putative toxin [Egbenema bharatensis]|uniref:phosphatase domain-containing putative toxin n=1 Tax=Egbenema bharatensis TaxID=3463334 RepID=UPI003A8C3763
MKQPQTQSNPLQPIAENLWWVIPGKLAGVRKPTEAELSQLRAMGIGAIVSVMDDPGNLDLYQAANFPYRWLPTQGGTAPTSEQVRDFRVFAEQQIGSGHAIAVHCTSGRRRTGTLIASYLIATGSSYEDAVQQILSANPQVELREAQTTFLQNLAAEQNHSAGQHEHE